MAEDWVLDALLKLNPVIAERPERAQEVLSRLRAVLLSAPNDGLVAANEEMVAWLCGRKTMRFVGTEHHVPVRLIDFDHPGANRLVVSTEVTYRPGAEERRYDVVLWVNGFPLVVGETKTPISFNTSWLNGAKDIHDGYEVKTAGFFVPNVLSFATEGKEFRYGAIRQPPETWLPWSRTTDVPMLPGLASVLYSAALLLAPGQLLDVLRTFTLFSRHSSTAGGFEIKVIPRYPQVEAVEAIVARVRDPQRRQGLVWHHQGSGKTLLMAFAAAKLRQTIELDAPTILIVLDRLELIEQTRSEFLSVGIPAMKVAETKEQLRQLLGADDARGVIVTTIFRFEGAGLLNDRSNIVVMVDEAHRTQEGRLGQDMRDALPNAKFIGLTGTPISTEDRNTWATFGDPDDPGGVLNHYSVERSIADGATLPIHVETRLVDFHIDSKELDQAFDELAQAERLDEREAGMLAKRASKVDQILKSPARVQAVCADIVAHYRAKVEPLGLKAQVVAFDRECCALYHQAITALLEAGRGGDGGDDHRQGRPPRVVGLGPRPRRREPDQGPIQGPRRPAAAAHRDRQAADRLRRPHRGRHVPRQAAASPHPIPGGVPHQPALDQPRRPARRSSTAWSSTTSAWAPSWPRRSPWPTPAATKALPAEVDELIDLLGEYVAAAMARFAGIDRSASGFEQLYAAQERLGDQAARAAFAADFLRAEGLFEFLWPDTALRPVRGRLQVAGPRLQERRPHRRRRQAPVAAPRDQDSPVDPRAPLRRDHRRRRAGDGGGRRRGVRGAAPDEAVALRGATNRRSRPPSRTCSTPWRPGSPAS